MTVQLRFLNTMLAKPQRKTTESGRRHAFKSFRERVDLMKIEPNRKLNIRAHDYVESSYFLVTLEHWKEVNISGDFTDFLYEVEPLCQTLAQVLHHQEKIFNALHQHILINDPNSIQPLLELVTQFIHDLGPDFMPFYPKFLNLVVELAQRTEPKDSQSLRSTSDVLEWCFNTLAFAFKYLSRTLVADLKPTFEELIQVLTITKRTYIARFCAEALSFLLKKVKLESLKDIVRYLFSQEDLLENNSTYRDSLVVLFSEAMKNTQETFHSRSPQIFSVLLEYCLELESGNELCISCLSDILLIVFRHGDEAACASFYSKAVDCLQTSVNATELFKLLIYASEVLVTLCFADSGRKVPSWDQIFETISALANRSESLSAQSGDLLHSFMLSFIQLLSIVMRNCDIHILAKHFSALIGHISSLREGDYFLAFFDGAFGMSPPKMIQLGALLLLQVYINNIATESRMLRLTRTLITLSENHQDVLDKLSIPISIRRALFVSIEADLRNSDDPSIVTNLLWKFRLLTFVSNFETDEALSFVELFMTLSVSKLEHTRAKGDTLGLAFIVTLRCLQFCSNTGVTEQVYSKFVQLLDTCKTSPFFLKGGQQFLSVASDFCQDKILSDLNVIRASLAVNLSLPNANVRVETIDLLTSLYKSLGSEISPIISQMKVIDQMPLDITHTNDMKMRIRQLFSTFGDSTTRDPSDAAFMINFSLGLLSNQFQPCWLAVYEGLHVFEQTSFQPELWDRLMYYITFDYESNEQAYHSIELSMDSLERTCVAKCQPVESRLSANFERISSAAFANDNECLASIFGYARAESSKMCVKVSLRNRALKGLKTVPRVAEQHGEQLIELLLSLQPENSNDQSLSWLSNDKQELLSIFSKFKKLGKLTRSEELFNCLLHELSSKKTSVQKESIEVILAWNISSINKYKDSLKNLLDDKLFRDELQSLLSNSSESKIEAGGSDKVMPIILRILYGRAKGVSNNNSKSGRKFAIATILPNLPEDTIKQYLTIMSESIPHDQFGTGSLPDVTKQSLTNMMGYLNMLTEVYHGLGFKFSNVLGSTVEPLIFILLCAQGAAETMDEGDLLEKIAKNVRQLGYKCLSLLFKITSSTYDWSNHALVIYSKIVKPRLPQFSQENAQQPSSLMRIMLGWMESPSQIPLYYFDDYSPVRAILSILFNPHTKDAVLSDVLDFCILALTRKPMEDDRFFSLLAIIVEEALSFLPHIIGTSQDHDLNAKSATLLLLIIEGGYVQGDDIRGRLVVACSTALEKPPSQIATNDKVSILLSIAPVVEHFDCSFEQVGSLFESCAKAFRVHKDRNIRGALVHLFEVFGNKFTDLKIVGELLSNLNAYSSKRIAEPDFERRLSAFAKINENLFGELTAIQWKPIIYCCLFFINDHEELALRSNAAYTLMRYVDCYSQKPTLEDAQEFLAFFNSVIKPSLRSGFKKDSEEVKDGYVNVLAHIVRHGKYTPEFSSMEVLLSDEESEDFFKNFTHIQITARQKAVRALIDIRDKLSPESIEQYILPMTEVYTVCKDERYRNLLDDVHSSWSYLVRCISWEGLRRLFRKHVAAASHAAEHELRDKVKIVVRLSQAMYASIKSQREGNDADLLKNIPLQEKIDSQIIQEMYEPMMKILKVRNDDTIVQRAPLAEAAVNCLLCVSEPIAEARLSGTLTSTCQVMRSRTQHLRDAIRKTLCKVADILGPRYLKFIIKELKTALSRGSQIHVLSYTVHSVLVSIQHSFVTGDLDDSASLIVDIIMEDTFGSAGQEKDAEDYVSKMREVKSKKSFDSAEILSATINLNHFQYLVEPVKLLLSENVNLRSRQKLDELLRRYAAGVFHNSQSSSRDILKLCYELYQQSEVNESKSFTPKKLTESEEHFLVQLNARPARMSRNSSQCIFTLQRMCFELMRTSLGKHASLSTTSNLDGFMPLFEKSLDFDDEPLLVALYKMLDLIIKVPFLESRDAIFMKSATRAFEIIQNSPSTTTELCQITLRYLATVIRHKQSINLNEGALSYLLIRLMPDLEEPDKQGLAFNFLRSIITQHVMLPEVYEVMEKVSSILVVNHNKEIRDMSRSIYFQFLMEYEQGPAKLDKAFKFMVNNLNYPSGSGRQSVMELMHSIVIRSSPSLLDQLATSFFVGLANVAVSDDVPKCREMASAILEKMIKKLGPNKIEKIEKFVYSWMLNDSNNLLKRCGLVAYKIYVSVFGFGHSDKLDTSAIDIVGKILLGSKNSLDAQGAAETTYEWEDVYTALNIFSGICSSAQQGAFGKSFQPIWVAVFDTLLYPHTWVRLLSAQLTGQLLDHMEEADFEITPLQLQTITYRMIRQLSAPVVSERLGSQVVKNLIKVITKWEEENTSFLVNDPEDDQQKDGNEPPKYSKASDFVVSRICGLMRQQLRTDGEPTSKISAIQLAALITQIVTIERLNEIGSQLLMGLYNITHAGTESSEPEEVVRLAKECLKILEDRLGVTEYTALFSSVKAQVDERRYERRVKRTQLGVNAPEVAARRKMRKHERFRENRKHDRDANGYYKPKRRKF